MLDTIADSRFAASDACLFELLALNVLQNKHSPQSLNFIGLAKGRNRPGRG
jgi:hypothetical protein